jgi:hypothetical protein
MRKLGKYISKDCKQDVLWVDSLTMIPGVGGERGKFDIVLLGQVLQEVPKPPDRIAILETLWKRVTDGTAFSHLTRW